MAANEKASSSCLEPQAESNAWISPAHVDARGARDPPSSSTKRPLATDSGLTPPPVAGSPKANTHALAVYDLFLPSQGAAPKRRKGNRWWGDPPTDRQTPLIGSALPRAGRLKRTEAFRRVYRGGNWAHSASLSVGVYPNGLKTLRLGLRTKRGLKGAAVRNRLKRQVRAVYQSQKDGLSPGHDMVIVIHPRSVPVDSSRLKRELLTVCTRLNLLS